MSDEKKFTVQVDEDLEDLIPEYIENRKEDIEKIRECLKGQDYEQIRLLGHSMKGSGGGYGFDGITEVGKNIEIAAPEKEKSVIEKELCLLEEYFENVEIEYVESE